MAACETSTRAYPDGRTGTSAGRQAHRSAGEETCSACRTGDTEQRKTRKRTETRTSRQRAEQRSAWRKTALSRDPLMDRKTNLKARFGITHERYLEMLASQGDGCAVCGTKEPGGRHNTFFMVDHDHACCPGKTSCGRCVRGLVCGKCNLGLGQFDDAPDRLLAAAAYLLSNENVLTGRRS